MNTRILCSFLGIVSVLIGVAMLLCIPWGAFQGVEADVRGIPALLKSAALCVAVGLTFSLLGRGADATRLYRREGFAGVALCWVLAIILSALPYQFAGLEIKEGRSLNFCDAIFESASGLTTTGATVFDELEDPNMMPRSILFWRSMTHFLGGLGVMCCFVAILGQGARGKAVLKVEHSVSGNMPFTKMRTLAFSLFLIYVTLCAISTIWFLISGMEPFDAIYYSFSTIALGGFTPYNNSVGRFATDPDVSTAMVEGGLVFFMIVAGTNYWLLSWLALGKPGKLFRDYEWRAFIILLFVASIISTFVGLRSGDLIVERSSENDNVAVSSEEQVGEESSNLPALEKNSHNAQLGEVARDLEPAGTIETVDLPEDEKSASKTREQFSGTICRSYPEAFRKSMFHVVSLATGAGLCSERYESWNATTIILMMILIFIGGCSASTAGGIKVFRAALAFKVLTREAERRYNPSVVRVTTIDGEDVAKETADVAIRYVAVFSALIVLTTFVVAVIETNSDWVKENNSQLETIFDLGSSTLSMFANTGLAFGNFGSQGNYSCFSGLSKLIFSWAMIVGRLEIWPVLAILSVRFWRNR